MILNHACTCLQVSRVHITQGHLSTATLGYQKDGTIDAIVESFIKLEYLHELPFPNIEFFCWVITFDPFSLPQFEDPNTPSFAEFYTELQLHAK